MAAAKAVALVQQSAAALLQNPRDGQQCRALCAVFQQNVGRAEVVRAMKESGAAVALGKALATQPSSETLMGIAPALMALSTDAAVAKALADADCAGAVLWALDTLEGDDALLRQLAHVLRALAPYDSVRPAIIKNPENTLDILMKCIDDAANDSGDADTVASLLHALLSFLRFEECQRVAADGLDGQVIPQLLGVLEASTENAVKIPLISIMTALIRGGEDTRVIVFNEGCIGLGIDILADAMTCIANGLPQSDVLVRHCCEFLHAWPAEEDHVQQNILDEGGLKIILEVLLGRSGDPQATLPLTGTLKSLSLHVDRARALAEAGVVATLRDFLASEPVLKDPREPILTNCVLVIENISKAGIKYVHQPGLVVGLFDVMEKVITMVGFQVVCMRILSALWQANVGTVRQEVVDEGGMNLALSLFSTAVQQADVLLACFPLLQQMIAHAIDDPSPDSPLSEAEVQVLVAILSHHPTNPEVAAAAVGALCTLSKDDMNRLDIVRQQGLEAIGTLLAAPTWQEHWAAMGPDVLRLLTRLLQDGKAAAVAAEFGLETCAERLLGLAAKQKDKAAVGCAVLMASSLKGGPSPALVQAFLALLNNVEAAKLLGVADMLSVWQLLQRALKGRPLGGPQAMALLTAAVASLVGLSKAPPSPNVECLEVLAEILAELLAGAKAEQQREMIAAIARGGGVEALLAVLPTLGKARQWHATAVLNLCTEKNAACRKTSTWQGETTGIRALVKALQANPECGPSVLLICGNLCSEPGTAALVAASPLLEYCCAGGALANVPKFQRGYFVGSLALHHEPSRLNILNRNLLPLLEGDWHSLVSGLQRWQQEVCEDAFQVLLDLQRTMGGEREKEKEEKDETKGKKKPGKKKKDATLQPATKLGDAQPGLLPRADSESSSKSEEPPPAPPAPAPAVAPAPRARPETHIRRPDAAAASAAPKGGSAKAETPRVASEPVAPAPPPPSPPPASRSDSPPGQNPAVGAATPPGQSSPRNPRAIPERPPSATVRRPKSAATLSERSLSHTLSSASFARSASPPAEPPLSPADVAGGAWASPNAGTATVAPSTASPRPPANASQESVQPAAPNGGAAPRPVPPTAAGPHPSPVVAAVVPPAPPAPAGPLAVPSPPSTAPASPPPPTPADGSLLAPLPSTVPLQQQLLLLQQLLLQQQQQQPTPAAVPFPSAAPTAPSPAVAPPAPPPPAAVAVAVATADGAAQTETPLIVCHTRHALSQTVEMRIATDEMEVLRQRVRELELELKDSQYQVAQLEKHRRRDEKRLGELNDEIGEHRQTIAALRQQVTYVNGLQAKAQEGQHALALLVECRLDLARTEAELLAWKQQVRELVTRIPERPPSDTVGVQVSSDDPDQAKVIAQLTDKVGRLEDALRRANERESEREQLREKERAEERLLAEKLAGLADRSRQEDAARAQQAEREGRLQAAEAALSKREAELQTRDTLLLEEREELAAQQRELKTKRTALEELEKQLHTSMEKVKQIAGD
eukprot:EG_transcript_314